ncbi:hypothetical protein IMG5_080950, partial [Ichthyophthirius multifiliis]
MYSAFQYTSQYNNFNPYESKRDKEIKQEEAFEIQFSESEYQEDNIYTDQKPNVQLYKNKDVQKQVNFYQEEDFENFPTQKQYNIEINQSNKILTSKDQVQQKAIQIIQYDKSNDSFLINNEALQILKLYEEPICFVAIAGKYRTGKSFLMNKLLNLKKQGVFFFFFIKIKIKKKFKVDPSTQSCTQGIWMWSHPVLHNNKQIFFIDTEGSTSIEGNKKYDVKIFCLALLMSSLFIYNSVGAIDEKSIQELQLTTQISKNIQCSNKLSENEQIISQYTPKFIWLLRDFVLEIVDNKNNQINPNTYLNNCLFDESSVSKQTTTSRKIREALLNFFKQRECITMVRPVNNEEDLQNLNNLPVEKLKPQFVQQLNTLKNKIFEMAQPKEIDGVVLNSNMFASLLQIYVQQINEKGGVPNIQNAWDNIMERECQKSYEECIQAYNDQKIKLNRNSTGDIILQFEKLKNQILNNFKQSCKAKNSNFYYQEYFEKLQIYIENQERELNQYNDQHADTQINK